MWVTSARAEAPSSRRASCRPRPRGIVRGGHPDPASTGRHAPDVVAGRERDRVPQRSRRAVASGHERRRHRRAPDSLAAGELHLRVLARLVAHRGRDRESSRRARRAARRRAPRRLGPPQPRRGDVRDSAHLVAGRHASRVRRGVPDAESDADRRRADRRQRGARRRGGKRPGLVAGRRPDRLRQQRRQTDAAPRRPCRRKRRHDDHVEVVRVVPPVVVAGRHPPRRGPQCPRTRRGRRGPALRRHACPESRQPRLRRRGLVATR